MSDRIHILITGDRGKVRNLLLSRRRLKTSCVLAACLIILLSGISIRAYQVLGDTTALDEKMSSLNRQLSENIKAKDDLALQVRTLQQEKDALAQQQRQQEIAFQEEKTTLINSAVSELEERSNLIERVMGNIGVDVEKLPKGHSNSGGPFVAPEESSSQELLHRSDLYLDSLHYLPLGRPVPGPVTSRFGQRTDPVNGKRGIHTGVDMRGRTGQQIVATADGVVKKAFYNGSYGRYVEIDHGNGYRTKFAHMKKLLVKRGAQIKRGQSVGTVGNSGRSTGPHLHYEVCLNGKPVNPGKYMRVDKLATTPRIPRLTIQP
ncbi:MAG: peptidoglycan DD-metalloendopeptidase family protein, partial [Thermodesulfobacteriota bacterium]